MEERRRQFDAVPILSVDRLIQNITSSNTKPIVDILLIDAEGSDAEVIRSADISLRNGLIRMLVFEYHSECPWGRTSLKAVVGRLSAASYSYDCYFEGTGRLWKLTDGCWHDLYEIRQWSNVMCLLRGDIWHTIAEAQFRVMASNATAIVGTKALPEYTIPEYNKTCM